MSCGIYKITNLINNKIYIGQSVNIERRLNEHKRRDEQKIDKAIKKYGFENFNFEIIEMCQPDKLDELENYWIGYYNSLVPNGYNCVSDTNPLYGENNPQTTLSDEEVYKIREFYKNKTYNYGSDMWKDNYPQYSRDYIVGIFYGYNRPYHHMDVYEDKSLTEFYHNNLIHIGYRKPGELNPAAIVSDEDALKIRIAYINHQKQEIFQMFPQYKERTIVSILMGQNWKHIPIYRKRVCGKRPKGWEFPLNWDKDRKKEFLNEVNNVRI